MTDLSYATGIDDGFRSHAESDAYGAGLEDGEMGQLSAKLANETESEYAAYLSGFKEGRRMARQD